MRRCGWVGEDARMRAYHDEEWGVPLHDEQRHFEFLLLETMQAGLSWSTILNKREGFRAAFAGFSVEHVAAFGPEDVERLLSDAAIIRNRSKIEAAVNNAKCFLALGRDPEFGSFDAYIWSFTGGRPIDHALQEWCDMPVSDDLAERVSRDMKRRGFKFVGPTTIYAHLQAIGVVNDHEVGCFRYPEISSAGCSEG